METKERKTDALDPFQRIIFQQMSPQRKLEMALSLYYAARELKLAYCRNQHPNLSEAEIQEMVKEIFLYART